MPQRLIYSEFVFCFQRITILLLGNGSTQTSTSYKFIVLKHSTARFVYAGRNLYTNLFLKTCVNFVYIKIIHELRIIICKFPLQMITRSIEMILFHSCNSSIHIRSHCLHPGHVDWCTSSLCTEVYQSLEK